MKARQLRTQNGKFQSGEAGPFLSISVLRKFLADAWAEHICNFLHLTYHPPAAPFARDNPKPRVTRWRPCRRRPLSPRGVLDGGVRPPHSNPRKTAS